MDRAKKQVTFEEFIKACNVEKDTHILVLNTGKMSMAVRVPARFCYGIVTTTYNNQMDTDSVVQGVPARLWGIDKNPCTTIMSQQAALFFACRQTKSGLVEPKVKNLKTKSSTSNGILNLVWSEFKEILEKAYHDATGTLELQNSYKMALEKVKSLEQKLKDATRAEIWKGAGETKTRVTWDDDAVNHSKELYAIFNDIHIHELLEDHFGSIGVIGRNLLKFGQTVQRTREFMDMACRYKLNVHYDDHKDEEPWALLQFRWEGDKSWRVKNNFATKTGTDRSSLGFFQFNILGRWVDLDGKEHGWVDDDAERRVPVHQGAGYFMPVELHIVLSDDVLATARGWTQNASSGIPKALKNEAEK
jgi:hypothetical protein